MAAFSKMTGHFKFVIIFTSYIFIFVYGQVVCCYMQSRIFYWFLFVITWNSLIMAQEVLNM